MSETRIILKREFLERVRTRSFVLSTLLIPIFTSSLFVIPTVIGEGGGGVRRLALVDEAPAGVGDYVVEALARGAEPAEADAVTYRVERVPGPLASVREELNRRVMAEEIDGYVYLPPDVVDRNEITYRARHISNFSVDEDLRRAASEAVQAARLRRQGLEVSQVATMLRPIEVNAAKVTEQGENEGSAESTFFLAYIVGFLVYFLTFMYGVNVMRSVLEEKTNRIVEVIVSSVRPTSLMQGKILGVAAVALLQVSIWGIMAAVAASQSDLIAERLRLPPGAFDSIRVEPWVIFASLGFFLLGFFLYAALFAAVGAAVNSEQEAQQFQTVVFIPLIASMVFLGPVINDPLGRTATILGILPLTAPITMPMRMAAAQVPVMQVAASLLGLAVAVELVAWLAGKIYRVGILSTGKRPTLRELGRWIRAA